MVMQTIREKLAVRLPKLRDEMKELSAKHGDVKAGDVTIGSILGGMRGVNAIVCETSLVTPDKGLIVRGTPIGELTDKLPEEMFYLLLVGELPTKEELKSLQKDLNDHTGVPNYVWDVLRAMPRDSHPMTMLITAIMILQSRSKFAKRYEEGMGKTEFWQPALDDAIAILGSLPAIAAGVYRIRFNKGPLVNPDNTLDWASNYVHMLGLDDAKGEFAKLMQLFLTMHADHESGNVSAFTAHTVGSALSDPYYSVAAGLCGLAGPLHGVANQEVLRFVTKLLEKFGGVPTEEQLRQFTVDTLKAGRVVPGYGHAVLRCVDPRFTGFYEFGKKFCPNDDYFRAIDLMYKVVPPILKENSKAASIWPNVDAASGSLLYHFGLKEDIYYTVCFSVSRAMGLLAQYIIARGVGAPILRPKAVTLDWVKALASKK